MHAQSQGAGADMAPGIWRRTRVGSPDGTRCTICTRKACITPQPPSWLPSSRRAPMTDRRPLARLLILIAATACTTAGGEEHADAGAGAAAPPPPAATLGASPDSGPGTLSTREAHDSLSPHWPHVRTMANDYRIQYIADERQRNVEYDWAAAHFDHVVLDNWDSLSVRAYRRRNPAMGLYHYAILWTIVRPGEEKPGLSIAYYDHMQRWFAARPEYDIEKAFLHDAARCSPGKPPAECRVEIHLWTQDRWVINPGDPGARAYQGERLRTLASSVNGLFVDEQASGDMANRLDKIALREYPAWPAYQRDMVSLIRHVREVIGGERRLLINSATYSSAWDREMVRAAGGAHTEALNDPFHGGMEGRWAWVDSLVADGAFVQFSAGSDPPEGLSGGNEPTPAARRRLWQLASHYMVLPNDPAAVAFDPELGWREPYAGQWTDAVEHNIGRPLGPRHIWREGRDPTGRAYRIWRREFERAVVLVRPVLGWDSPPVDDASMVRTALPRTPRVAPLRSDGSVGSPVESVQLRAAEAVILLKR